MLMVKIRVQKISVLWLFLLSRNLPQNPINNSKKLEVNKQSLKYKLFSSFAGTSEKLCGLDIEIDLKRHELTINKQIP